MESWSLPLAVVIGLGGGFLLGMLLDAISEWRER